MSTKRRITSGLLRGAFVLPLLVAGCSPTSEPGNAGNPAATVGSAGGRLTATYRSEPSTYDRLTGTGAADGLFSLLTNDTLVRVNKATGAIEPRLAERWSHSDDGLVWTLELRQGVSFSDGEPFTADDVVFTFDALFDPKVASALSGDYRIAGQPLFVEAIGAHTVGIRFPAPYGPGIALFDGLPILPQHKLSAALEAGAFADAWPAGTASADLAGLGPFVLEQHVPGQKLVFARNPHFWQIDEAGTPLPYLEGLEVLIVPDQNAEMVQLESGAVDLISDFVRAEDVASLRALETAGQVHLVEAGTSPDADGLWFNLVPGGDALQRRPWLASQAFRRAVSTAVDRQAIVDTVFLGEAVPVFGPITPGYGDYYVEDLPKTPYAPDAARALLAEAGLTDRDGDGMLEDASGTPASFSILTQAGHTVRQRVVSLVREHLAEVGVSVTVESVDQGTIIARFGEGDYEAIYFGAQVGDLDPAGLAIFWMSAGHMHFWHPQQPQPATPWEAEMDAAFVAHAMALDRADRVRFFADAQRILAEQLPIIHFAAATARVAMSSRVGGAQPAVVMPPILWNAERLYVNTSPDGSRDR